MFGSIYLLSRSLSSFCCVSGIVLGVRDIGENKMGKNLFGGIYSLVLLEFFLRKDFVVFVWILEDFLEEILLRLNLKGRSSGVVGIKVE